MTSPGVTRLGVFGGRFDPPHTAHLIHARLVYELFELDTLLFIPAANPPHKDASVPFEHRANMVSLAIQDEEGFSMSLIEKERNLAYTSDTLEVLQKDSPDTKIYLLIGRDEYNSFSTWHDPQRVKELAELIVLPRQVNTKGRASPGVHFPDLPCLDISSSMIRERLRTGRSIRNLVPRQVEEYLEIHNLYKEV